MDILEKLGVNDPLDLIDRRIEFTHVRADETITLGGKLLSYRNRNNKDGLQFEVLLPKFVIEDLDTEVQAWALNFDGTNWELLVEPVEEDSGPTNDPPALWFQLAGTVRLK